MRYIAGCILLPAVFVAGCTLGPVAETHPPDSTALVAPPLGSPSPENGVAVSVTPVQSSSVGSRCIAIAPDLPANVTYQGSLVLEDASGTDLSPRLVRITNGETSDLPSESPPLIDVTSSPSRDRLAFIALGEEGAYSVALLNPDGTTSIVAPLLDDWVALASWINNTTLLVRKSAAANGSLPPSVVLLDTPTGAYREIELDFPGFYAPAADENLWHTSAFIDPSVSRVAYVALGEGDFEIRLWDLQEAKVIGELSPWNSAFGSPAWSSEGDRLFIPSYVSSELGDPREDFYSLSFEGESSRVTHLSEGASAADIGTFEISPHGDQLAFWLRGAAAEHETLHVLIPGAPEEITDLCILGNQDDSMSRPPIWSPSGREVLVTTTLPGGGLTSVVLIDLERDIAAVVAQNMEAVSWIGEP